MPIKWSATKVSEAITQVERELALAEGFIDNAEARVGEAKATPNLPEYMEQRLSRLEYELKRALNIGSSIEAVRSAIPDGAMETEQESSKHGSTQSIGPDEMLCQDTTS